MNLNVKLAVTVAVISVICATIIAGFSYQVKRQNIEHDIKRNLLSLSETVFNTATAAAYVGDAGLAQEVVIGLESNSIVACADIRFGGALSQQANRTRCEGTPDHARPLLSPFDSSEHVGNLYIFQDNDEVTAILQGRLIHEARTIAAILLFVAIATLLATYSFVTRPVQTLSNQLENIDLAKERPQTLTESTRKDEIGAIGRVIDLLLRNATRQIEREKLLNMQSQLMSENFKMTFELSQTAIAVLDGELRILSSNSSFKALNQKILKSEKALNKDEQWIKLFEQDELIQEKIQAQRNMHAPQTFEVKSSADLNSRHGQHWFKLTFNKTQDMLDNTNYLIFIDDITHQKQKLAESEHAANHDQLTGLNNRAAAKRQIEYWLSAPSEYDTIALMMLDLDGFKPINDTFGHDAGDEILKVISARLRAHTRSTDIVARWGGDEFVVALTSVDNRIAERIGKNLINIISQPILYRQEKLRVGASVGIAVAGTQGSSFKILLDTADKAMYDVKRNGKNGIQLMSA